MYFFFVDTSFAGSKDSLEIFFLFSLHHHVGTSQNFRAHQILCKPIYNNLGFLCLSDIYIYIHWAGTGVQIKSLRGRPWNGAHSLLMTLIWFFEKKRIKAKTFIQQRKSHYVELLWNFNGKRNICLSTHFLVSINYLLIPTPPLGQDMTQGQFLSGV